MKYLIVLKDTRNGKIAQYETGHFPRGEWYTEEENFLSWLEDGNGGCDCNRANFMYGYEKGRLCNEGANSIHVLRAFREDKTEVNIEHIKREQAE